MKEREREKGEEWGSSERVKERWRRGGEAERKEKKSLAKKAEKGNKDRKRGEEKDRLAGGLIAECLVVSCLVVGCFLFFFFLFPPAFTAVVTVTRPKPAGLFLKTPPVLQVHRDHPDSFAGRARELVSS